MYTYTVNDANTVEVFAEGQEAPILRQSCYPNQDTFDTKAEAEQWARLFIASMEDEAAPFAPIGKGIAGKTKPTEGEIQSNKAEILSILNKRAEHYKDGIPEYMAQRISSLEAELT